MKLQILICRDTESVNKSRSYYIYTNRTVQLVDIYTYAGRYQEYENWLWFM